MGKDQELLDACRKGNLATVEKLLSAKLAAKGKGPKAAGASGGTFSLVKIILKGANVNCVDHSGDTPLHLAALNGFLEIVSLLLDCDANPSILDTQDCSPLHLAAWGGHADICSQLLQTTEGQALLNLQTRDGNTALHFAACHGYVNVLSLLLQKGADPVIRNLEDKSPLDLAASYDRMDIVTQLVTSHPELLAQRSVQNTPLHLASRQGHKAVVRYLLDSGFPIDAKTDKGSALHEASIFFKLDVIRLLLERGIDISVKSETGCTAEDILRSIPSKDAEKALNILKTHIYHQRTPDSDGEKSIAGEAVPEILTTRSQQGMSLQANARSSYVENSSSAEQKSNLYKSLPTSTASSTAPPAIPPRLSIRVVDRKDVPPHPGLPPLTVPPNCESNSLLHADSPNEEEKSKPSISPSSKSPSELPKKPPRKGLSFRRSDPDASSSVVQSEPTVTVNNYVNIDPEVEKAALDAKLDHNKPKETQNAETSAPTSSTMQDQNDKSVVDVKERKSEGGHDGTKPEHSAPTEDAPCSSESVPIAKEQTAVEADPTEVSSSPPTSLDITPSKRVSTSPPTPTPRCQPPTPDCPPPSPSTALLNIQKQILPGENRRSKDMETITDSSLTEKDEAAAELRPRSSSANEVTSAVTLPRPAPKKKPTPLPRKSSLTSETRDLPRTRSASATEASLPAMEGYSGARPALNIVPARVSRDSTHSLEPQRQGQDVNRSSGSSRQSDASSERISVDTNSSFDGVTLRSAGSGGDGEEAATVSLEDYDNEPVQLRRSASAENNPGMWDEHVFAGLLRGSTIGPPRAVSYQFEDSNVTAAALRNRKRKSTRSAFAPVMEEDKDLDPEKMFNDIDKINLDKNDGSKKEVDDNVFDDFSDDWDQIAETISSYGGRISSSGDYAFFEAQIDHLLSGKGDDKIQSVGSWLADIGLAQYENTLVANGFDDTDFLGGSILEQSDLEHIGVSSADHRKAILEAARKLPAVQTIDPDNLPATVAEWLGSLRLDYYFDTFMSHKFDSMNRVIQLWELELVTVLDITSVGHRKRILASLGDKRPEPNISPARTTRIASFNDPVKSPFDHVDLYHDYTGARSRVNDAGSDRELGQGSLLGYDSSSNGSAGEGRGIRDEALHLRAPHLMHETGSIKQWRHKPEILIKGCCNYTAHYLGSTLVKELKGAMSTQEGIAKLKKSSAVISKIPTIMLSISFKGVKFIDAISKKVVCDHEIANIFCACQDGEHMNFFAYITKDKQAGLHYCHVFSVRSRELAGEIILTLGEAFEIAYQMALKEKAESEADKFDKLFASDGDETNSVSSKTSSNPP